MFHPCACFYRGGNGICIVVTPLIKVVTLSRFMIIILTLVTGNPAAKSIGRNRLLGQ